MKKDWTAPVFFHTWAGRSYVEPAGETSEAGSRKFLSDGEGIMRDHNKAL